MEPATEFKLTNRHNSNPTGEGLFRGVFLNNAATLVAMNPTHLGNALDAVLGHSH